ncbi:YitT family protein [Paenibacillus polysaccharolyticus]|uniref:YczE/YyaS/YitT family protein n=1 Tax=Paenibacillus polysaccharolyticus TaxID=582692 RepID=UPI00209CABE6|nr:YitT family protein [Paenibacillus polysaccharolyticus]MCP1133710.1 YitT family protein [Paenibacillus polysaccharolyticus]
MMPLSRVNQYLIYAIGILILTLGITLTIQSELGSSPFDALLVGLSLNVGLTIGSWEIIIALVMIFLNSLLQKQKPEYLGLVTALITGICIDFWLLLLRTWVAPDLLFLKFLCFGSGLVVAGIGTAMYLQTNFAPIPIDRLTLSPQKITRTNIFFARTLINVVILFMAFIFNGPIGIGTALAVCFSGAILNVFMPCIGEMIEKWSSTESGSNEVDGNHSV